jgi:hypothetical protein
LRTAAQAYAQAILIIGLVNVLRPEQLAQLRAGIREVVANPARWSNPPFVPAALNDEFNNMVSGILQSIVLADSDDARDKAIAELWKSSGGTTTDNP